MNMATRFDRALVWMRRDLRVDDHAALRLALQHAQQVWCAFVFDTELLDALPRADRRVEFIRDSLVGVDASLRALAASHGIDGVGLLIRHGRTDAEVPALARHLGVQAVFAAHDDDPAARTRDARLHGLLAGDGVLLSTVKDHVVFERKEVLTANGLPYTVFTPYKNAWLKRLQPGQHLAPLDAGSRAAALAPRPPGESGVPTLAQLGFEPTNLHELKLPSGSAGAEELLDDFLGRIDDYARTRDYPAVKGPSYLGVHLRFGTVSVRRLARLAWERMVAGSRGAEVWLGELVWREFFHQVLHHHPHVVERCFRPAYEALRWERGKVADAHFQAWCDGRTGYPLVDAAMRQLRATGYMHNRLRMVVASFLCKDLGLDWRRGEAWFARHLNDFELASNNGGWQWAASTGCDAQPYFRIFNPESQSRRFDPEGRFIRRYVPELEGLSERAIHAPWKARPIELAEAGLTLGDGYPAPIVDHGEARRRTLARYAAAREKHQAASR